MIIMKTSLEKARQYMDSGKAADLIHACLELRMAIENHVYEKLKYFSTRHGTKLLYKAWQPDKALKILSQIEPRSDQSYTLSFAKEDSSGRHETVFKQLGKHEALSAKWTRKNYNKLGAYLHLQPNRIQVPSINVKDLEPIYEELLRVSRSSLIADFSETLSFGCQLCESSVTACVDALPDVSLVYCPNTKCNATYLAEYMEGSWRFIINATDFVCPECNNKQLVLENELKIGALITCTKCKERYVIANHHYGLQKYQD